MENKPRTTRSRTRKAAARKQDDEAQGAENLGEPLYVKSGRLSFLLVQQLPHKPPGC